MKSRRIDGRGASLAAATALAGLLVMLGGQAQAFGPEQVHVTSITFDGGVRADVLIDGVAAEADWLVRLNVNPGWIVVGSAERSLTPSEADELTLSFDVATVGKATPDTFIATLSVEDPSGEFYGTRSRARFAAPTSEAARSAGWTPISSEVDASFLDVSAEVLVREGPIAVEASELPYDLLARVAAAQGVTPEALLTSGGGTGGAAMESGCSGDFRYITGEISFWDIRDSHVSDASGARLPSCDHDDTTCDIDDTGCCFHSLIGPEVKLYSWDDHAWISSSINAYDGSYVAWDSCWEMGKTYQLAIAMNTAGASGPGSFRILNSSGATDPLNFNLTGLIDFDDGVANYFSASVNLPASPDTLIGEDANLFSTVWRTMSVVGASSGENDSRIRWGYGTTTDATITVRYYGTGAGRSCSTSEIWVPDGDAGGQTAVYLLGYLYNGRVTGCSGSVATYPDYHGGEYDPWTGEGNALVAAIPATLLTVSYFDPQVATNTSVYNYVWPCYADGYNNVNRASSERNNFLALWEFIDADTSNTSGYGYDYLDLKLKDVMDGLVDLKNEPGTGNRTSGEATWVWVKDGCSSSEYCSNGHVCLANRCYTGDPHGENIRDLVDHIADVKGGYKPYYTSTLKSSPCIGTNDDTYPFTGGYRED